MASNGPLQLRQFSDSIKIMAQMTRKSIPSTLVVSLTLEENDGEEFQSRDSGMFENAKQITEEMLKNQHFSNLKLVILKQA